MQELIDVFRMKELSEGTRAEIIVKLGEIINYRYGANITEPLVYELVWVLNPCHEIFSNDNFLRKAKK